MLFCVGKKKSQFRWSRHLSRMEVFWECATERRPLDSPPPLGAAGGCGLGENDPGKQWKTDGQIFEIFWMSLYSSTANLTLAKVSTLISNLWSFKNILLYHILKNPHSHAPTSIMHDFTYLPADLTSWICTWPWFMYGPYSAETLATESVTDTTFGFCKME